MLSLPPPIFHYQVRPPAHSKSRVMGYRLMPAVVPQSFLVPVVSVITK